MTTEWIKRCGKFREDGKRRFTVMRTYVRDTTFDGQAYKAGDEHEFWMWFETLEMAEEWCELTNPDYENDWQYRVLKEPWDYMPDLRGGPEWIEKGGT